MRSLLNGIQSWFSHNGTGEVLVDNDLLLWCYLEGGLIESAACFAGYLIALVILHIPLDASAKTFFKKNAPELVLTNGKIVYTSPIFCLLFRPMQVSRFDYLNRLKVLSSYAW